MVTRDWHARSVADVAAAADTDTTSGLTGDEAQRRLAADGPNALEAQGGRGPWRTLLAQFASPLIAILLVALVITVILAEYADAAVIAAVLVLNTVIGFVQERRAEQSVQALMDLVVPQATVIRDGHEMRIDAETLVVGDLIVLRAGAAVPADVRLVSATTLDIDESLLTGESVAVRKHTNELATEVLSADRANMAVMGSTVVNGRGRGIVVETGETTELGQIALAISAAERPQTPLQQRMSRLARLIAVAVLAATGVAFVTGLALGNPASDMFLTAVALAVAVVPEGLPIAVTVALALGVRRMAQRNAIVRSLPAVETLGSTDVIGSDKTGTLTANEMTLVAAWLGEHIIEGDELTDAELGPLLTAVVATSEAHVEVADGQLVVHSGDETEIALLRAAARRGIDVTSPEPVAAEPFASERRYAAVIVETGAGAGAHHVVGAPEVLVARLADPGDLVERASDAADAMAQRGLRVIAIATRQVTLVDVDPEQPPAPEALELLGLVGLQDPPRPGVPDAVARCRDAGVRTIMITGDHAATAAAIAAEVGIAARDARVVTGDAVAVMEDDELADIVQEVDVFARVAPEHKLRIVRALAAHDKVVAVTGDGVNDGPALKAADIGVAMGRAGTDVAREASDIVLTDDNFVSIVAAVEEGRVVFDNVRKVTYFLLSTGAAAIIAIMTSLVAGMPLPYTPAALLWLNVVTNGVQDVALAFERGDPDVLHRPPRRRSEGIVSGVLWERVVLTGIVMALGSLWLYSWAIDKGLADDVQRGVALTTLVFSMVVHVFTARSESRSIIATHVVGNPLLVASSAGAVALHLLAMQWGPTQQVLSIGAVPAAAWSRIGLVCLIVVLASEVHKAVRSRRALRRSPNVTAAREA